MKYVLFRLSAVTLVLLMALLSGVILIGQMSPPVPVLVSIGVRTPQNFFPLRSMDMAYRTMYERYLEQPPWRWSDNHCRIAFASDWNRNIDTVTILEMSGGRQKTYALDEDMTFGISMPMLRWSPDHRLLVSFLLSNEKLPVVAVIDTWQETVRYLPLIRDDQSGPWINVVGWSPDGRWLVYLSKNAYLLDVASGEIRELKDAPPVLDWQWSDDGQFLSVTEESPHIVNSLTGETINLADRLPDTIYATAWSPTGHSVAFSALMMHGSGSYSVYRYDVDTDTLTTLFSLDRPAESPDWSPDGRWLAFVSFTSAQTEKIRVVNSQTGEMFREIEIHEYVITHWSPDSRYLLLSQDDVGNVIRVLDMHTGKLIEWTPFNTLYSPVPQWYPDSRHFSIGISRTGAVQTMHIARMEDGEISLADGYPGVGIDARLCFPEAAD